MTRIPDSTPITLESAVAVTATRALLGTLIDTTSPLGYSFVDFALTFDTLVGVASVLVTVDATLDGTTWFQVPAVLATATAGAVGAGQWVTTYTVSGASATILHRSPNTYKGLRVYAAFDAGTGNGSAVASRGVNA